MPRRSPGVDIVTVTFFIIFPARMDRLFNKFRVDATVITQVAACADIFPQFIDPAGATPKQRMLRTSRHLSDNNVKKAQFIMFLQKIYILDNR